MDFFVCYVLTDDEKRKYTKQLLISIRSVKKHMPDIPVKILTDNDTYSMLDQNLFRALGRNISLLPIPTPDNYSKVLTSRYLKTNLRSFIKGDFLYIDTDTVICKPFPEVISSKSLAFVEDRNHSLLDCKYAQDCLTNKYMNGNYPYDIRRYSAFYNGGVIWSKDDEVSKAFFHDWNKEWASNGPKKMHQDQPSLNYIIASSYSDLVETLPKEWNFAIGTYPSIIHQLESAYIIHYIDAFDRVFLLNDEKNLDNEAVIQKVIENPYDALVPYRLSLLSDDYFIFFRKYDALQGALYSFSKKHPVAYQKLSDFVSFASKVKNHH